MVQTAKRHEFAVGLDEVGVMFAEGRAQLDPPRAWTPEHLLLGALARCSMASLRFHARRAGLATDGRATASGAITRRGGDGRFAFVEEHVALDVHITPEPAEEVLVALLKRAERDCFVGASHTIAPGYAWRVNGRDVETMSAQELLEARHPEP